MSEEQQSANDNLGDHLLGRLPDKDPDPRNFDASDVMRRLEQAPAPGDDLAGKTFQEAHDEGYFTTWKSFLAIYHWIKAYFGKTPVTPAPPIPPTPPTPGPGPSPAGSWVPGKNLDQGQSSRCIGNGGEGYLGCTPVADAISQDDATALYCECTVLDGNPETPSTPLNQQRGSTVHTLAKALKNRGRISVYAWAKTSDDVVKWLESYGPVIFGIDWTNVMFTPDADGRLHLTGGVAGGHCIFGYRAADGKIWIRNSWGASWGVQGPGDPFPGGDAYLLPADVDKLLKGLDGYPGEALTCLELPLPA